MKFTLPIFFVSTLVLSIHSFAQDRIYTRSGGEFEVKIKEINPRSVIYKKWKSQDGPDYVMPKNEIDRIKYSNGDEEKMSTRSVMARQRVGVNNARYPLNTFSILPLAMNNFSAVGVGISYERFLDKGNFVSLYLPIVFSFNNRSNYYNNNTGLYEKSNDYMTWFMPGCKFYPTSSNGIVRYAVGGSLSFASGQKTYTKNTWDPAINGYRTDRTQGNITMLGFMVNNSLNIQPTQHLHLGLEMGLGIPYYVSDKTANNGAYASDNVFSNSPLIQFNFNIGYRF
ncbi:MAG: hypothetical protein JSS78_03725 [Bacteroidetes bacterium]|nr:hypothetical protein [Bacteroidota bacterium]